MRANAVESQSCTSVGTTLGSLVAFMPKSHDGMYVDTLGKRKAELIWKELKD